jgi:hypothetical protein
MEVGVRIKDIPAQENWLHYYCTDPTCFAVEGNIKREYRVFVFEFYVCPAWTDLVILRLYIENSYYICEVVLSDQDVNECAILK